MPTFIEIANQMRKLRDPSKYPIYAVRTFMTQASPGIKAVLYKGTVQGEESEYPTYMQFRNVEFSEEEKPGFIPFEATDKTGGSKMSFYKVPELNKNPVVLKCACLTGDTLISLVDGYSVPIKDLVGRNYFYVYSFDINTRKVVIGKGYNCEVKEKSVSLVEVELDNGNKIRCTLDHKFFLKSGIWKEAKDLQFGDSLQALYRRLGNRDKIKEYEQVLQENSWDFTHDLSDKYNLENGVYQLSQGTIRHHMDFNKFNNSPKNILRMRWYLHNKLHHDKMIGDGNPMKRKEVVEKVKKTNIEAGNYEKIRKRMINNNPMKNKDVVNQVVETSRERGNYSFEKMSKMSLCKTEEGLSRIGVAQRKLIDEGKHIGLNKMIKVTQDLVENGEHHFQTEDHKIKTSERQRDLVQLGTHPFQSEKCKEAVRESNRRRSEISKNHKVISVKFLEEKEDVYCFTVEKYGNFFIDVDKGVNLSSGVLSHNCTDFRFMWEYPLYKAKSLIGQFRRYVRKTTTYPPKNPEGILGYCKHIASFVEALRNSKLVK